MLNIEEVEIMQSAIDLDQISLLVVVAGFKPGQRRRIVSLQKQDEDDNRKN